MSVIAKLNRNQIVSTLYSDKYTMSCVCENALMASYSPGNENVLFTTASPWGEATFELTGTDHPKAYKFDSVYFIFTKTPQPEAMVWDRVRCGSIEDFGGTSKHLKFASVARPWDSDRRAETPPEPKQIARFQFAMAVDNPGASCQFKPGEEVWYIGLYACADHTMDDALALAHRFAAEEKDEAGVDA